MPLDGDSMSDGSQQEVVKADGEQKRIEPGTVVKIVNAETCRAKMGKTHWVESLREVCDTSGTVIRDMVNVVYIDFGGPEKPTDDPWEVKNTKLTFPRACLVVPEKDGS